MILVLACFVCVDVRADFFFGVYSLCRLAL